MRGDGVELLHGRRIGIDAAVLQDRPVDERAARRDAVGVGDQIGVPACDLRPQ